MKRPRNGFRKWLLRIGVPIACVLLIFLVYKGGRWLETRNAGPAARGNHLLRYEYADTIQVDGVSYRKRNNVTSILLMGVDRTGDQTSTGFRNGGQADFLQLLVIDSQERRITRLQIDRDTMTPITILGVLGNRSGVRTSQISLSHGFGDGKEQSCELTADAVSNLLLGTTIDHYVAMNLDGITALNDVVGGVTVTLEDDFSAWDPAMTPGTTLTLKGKQAEIFVRTRRGMDVGTNAARMVRQQAYIEQLLTLIDEKLQTDESFIGTIYDALEPYLITNVARGTLINQAWTSRSYERAPAGIEGEHIVGADGFMQYYADEAALKQLVLDLFYKKVQ